MINLVHHTENRMKKSFVVTDLNNFKFSKMVVRKRYTNINEMIDMISSTDESDLEYVEENLTNETSV